MSEGRAEQRGMTISDPQVMRALAHPVRLRIMEHFSVNDEPVTATECARVVGLSPSATSYHLRALAGFGLVEQAPSRGDARERLWRSAVQSWRVETDPDAASETWAAQGLLIDAFLTRDYERIRTWAAGMQDEPRDWYDATIMSSTVLELTAEELTEVNAAVMELLEPYKRRNRGSDLPAGTRSVWVHYTTVPKD